MINSRPLTYLTGDVNDLQPLTPSLFLKEIHTGSMPELDVFDSAHLNKRFRYRQKLKRDIMRRFRLEYLDQLKNYTKCKPPTALKIGEIVPVGNDNTKRLEWPMAKILELYPGKDNNTRVARVKTMNGELVRLFQRLYPLEVQDEQRLLLTEESSSRNPDISSPLQVSDDIDPEEYLDSSKVPDSLDKPICKTRSGRVVKNVKRLDL